MAFFNSTHKSTHTAPDHNRSTDDYDSFYEAMPATADSHYAYGDDLAEPFHPISSALRFITAVFSGLLIIRFLVSLFEPDRSIPLINLLFNLSDWLVAPFIMLVTQTPAANLGYVDWPAVLALASVAIIGGMLTRAARMARL